LLAAAGAAGAFPKKVGTALGKKIAEREALGSTGIGNGVAVPHAKADDVKAVSLALGRAKGGIEWHAIDGRPVQIVFLVTAPTGEAELHLRCLRWISGLARNADFRRFFHDAPDAEAIRELLLEMSPGD
jgi:PTS system nitrogen regulatory IIA component